MIEDTQAVTILIIEDDEVASEGIIRAFRKNKIANPIVIARDGAEGLELLRKQDSPVRQPYVILLDLNLPKVDGLEFLEELRKDPKTHESIVFVLTTSNSDEDMAQAYKANVAGYIVKNNAGDEFQALVDMLNLYWRFVVFPPGDEPQVA